MVAYGLQDDSNLICIAYAIRSQVRTDFKFYA